MSGYENMSERGRLVAEYLELAARYDVVIARAVHVPGLKKAEDREGPKALRKELEGRFNALTNEEQVAVLDLRDSRFCRGQWKAWTAKQVSDNPGDAADLYFVQMNFSGNSSEVSEYVWNRYGLFDRDWRMHHEW